ncbi:MAG: protein-glutamate O-methyltransferase family protein, partial [Chloroflexi bacterium]|nr:protein-glutamate O-methyltransferase family protein [Chloroflexota bacterium]
MLPTNHPHLAQPPFLSGHDTPFVYHTITQRLPNIVQRVLAENDLPTTAVSQLSNLLDEIENGVIRPLSPHLAPDLGGWQAAIAPYEGQPWLQVPWFFAETYFYRCIITAVDHFRSGIDPYLQQKQQSLRSSKSQINTLISQLNQMIAQGWQMEDFRQLLLADLWGNQADMSMWTADDANMPSHANSTDQLAHLLADDRLAAQKLLQKSVPQVDFIIDNAGFELVGDLCLADYLLATGRVATVRFHLKLFP